MCVWLCVNRHVSRRNHTRKPVKLCGAAWGIGRCFALRSVLCCVSGICMIVSMSSSSSSLCCVLFHPFLLFSDHDDHTNETRLNLGAKLCVFTRTRCCYPSPFCYPPPPTLFAFFRCVCVCVCIIQIGRADTIFLHYQNHITTKNATRNAVNPTQYNFTVCVSFFFRAVVFFGSLLLWFACAFCDCHQANVYLCVLLWRS